MPVLGLDGTALGTVDDIYRAGAAEVLVVRGGPLGELDVPNVASIVREFAPREGRIVVDAAVLDLDEAPPPRRPRGRRTRRAHDAAAAAGDRTTDAADPGAGEGTAGANAEGSAEADPA